nr:MAG TPA: hypothetical protein [Caudoviricetes sp.]
MVAYNINKMQVVEEESTQIETIVNEIVNSVTKEIDDYIENIKHELDGDDLTISELNLILMRLCSFSYYLASKQEMVGIRQDISSTIEKERFNLHFINSTGTVASKTSQAEEKTKEERVISIVWEKSYKILKNKYDSINRYIDSIKKIITTKVKEMELSR